jgi:DNA-binding MarR family transcriptional regulator
MIDKRLSFRVMSVLEEHESSPGLLLALLGYDAMRRLRAAHDAHGLKPRQFQILGLLERGGLGQRELGERMGLDPSVVVGLLNPLEQQGYLARDRDLVDRRRHTVNLTPRGLEHLAAAAQAQRAVEDEIFASLDPQQREQLRQLLLALNAPPEADCA